MTIRPAPAAPIEGVDPKIVSDIRRAAKSANVDFGYLMAQAKQESDFNPNAKASSSSATGLYQFIDSTWLHAVKDYGAKYGLANYANAISDDNGAHVSDHAMRQQILDLRKNPTLNAALAAELAHSNMETVERSLGRKASATDLYLAHFLGAEGATRVAKTLQDDSQTKAADLLPQAAEANRSVFFDKTGNARSVSQIYRYFASKIEGQINRFMNGASAAENSGSFGDDLSDAKDSANIAAVGIDAPGKVTQPMITMMNMLSLAAMRMLGHKPDDKASEAAQTNANQANSTQANSTQANLNPASSESGQQKHTTDV